MLRLVGWVLDRSIAFSHQNAVDLAGNWHNLVHLGLSMACQVVMALRFSLSGSSA
jgi:hypothetical protein